MDEVMENGKPQKQIERVTIEDQLKEKLTSLTEQANAALQGVATITKSDVANMILSQHSHELNPTEIETLRATHVDQVKFAFWVANRLKEARANGENLTMEQLLVGSQSVVSDRPARMPRRPRKKKDTGAVVDDVAKEQSVAE